MECVKIWNFFYLCFELQLLWSIKYYKLLLLIIVVVVVVVVVVIINTSLDKTKKCEHYL